MSGPASDRWLLYGAAFLRALATGLAGVVAGLYLARRGLEAGAAGAVIGAGLAGVALAALLATGLADRFGRRRSLGVLGLAGGLGGFAFAAASSAGGLAALAFVGMLNGMGRDRGAALVIEQAVLPGVTVDRGRTRAFAWYNVLQDAGHALGALLAGGTVLLRAAGWSELDALRAAVTLAAALTGVSGALAAGMTPAVEAPACAARVGLSPGSRRLLVRISSLFALDSLGGGFLTASLVSWFFFRRFGVDEGVLGPLFFAARLLNAASHLGAAWLAARIGLVNTMVFTHIPSSLLLVTVAIAPSFPVAVVLFLLREGLVEMDVPTRQSYVMAVVRPEERMVASGVTHLVRVSAWAVAPPVAGAVMQAGALGLPLMLAAGTKIAYDLLLWRAFRHVKPPEERLPARPPGRDSVPPTPG